MKKPGTALRGFNAGLLGLRRKAGPTVPSAPNETQSIGAI
jgi:hypothetical protein